MSGKARYCRSTFGRVQKTKKLGSFKSIRSQLPKIHCLFPPAGIFGETAFCGTVEYFYKFALYLILVFKKGKKECKSLV
jgi:hypothetical protein